MWASLIDRIYTLLRHLHNFYSRSKSILNAGAKMGIHYDYKSTRGEKAMKKRQKKSTNRTKKSQKKF